MTLIPVAWTVTAPFLAAAFGLPLAPAIWILWWAVRPPSMDPPRRR